MKDKLHRIGETSKFNITREVLKEYNMAHSWYAVALAKKKEEEQKETERRKKDNECLEMGKSLSLQISDLDRKIRFFLINFIYTHHITFLWLPNSHFYPFCQMNPCLCFSALCLKLQLCLQT